MSLILIFLLLTTTLHAKDLGTHGHTYPIEEKSLLELIQEKLSQSTPEKQKELHQTIQKKYIKIIQEPTPIELPQAKTYRVAYFDPTITTKQEIKDHEGNILIPKGTKHNPLTQASLEEPLLFFDGSDPKQVEWAKHQPGKWILIRGRPIELEEKEQKSIYFDQFGHLTRKLDIQAIPAKVTQEELLLKVEEVLLEPHFPLFYNQVALKTTENKHVISLSPINLTKNIVIFITMQKRGFYGISSPSYQQENRCHICL